jgi:hypothetical protein
MSVMNDPDIVFISSKFITSFNHLVEHIANWKKRCANQLGVLKQKRFEALKNFPIASNTLIEKIICIACMFWKPILQRIIKINL